MHRTPLSAVARGVAAGIAGTGLMTAWQLLSARLQSSAEEQSAEADQSGDDPWESASAPAKVAKRISEGVLDQPVSADRIPLLTNAMHWGYGTAWGALYGIAAGGRSASGPKAGLAFGTIVWLASYAQLVPMGLYEPPWKYAPKDIGMELSYHLVYGFGVAGAYAVLSRG